MSPADETPAYRALGPGGEQRRRLARTLCPYTRPLTPSNPRRPADARHQPILTRVSQLTWRGPRRSFFWTCGFCELREPLAGLPVDVLDRSRRRRSRDYGRLFWHLTLTGLLLVGTTLGVVTGRPFVGITFVVLVWSTLALVNRIDRR